MWGPAASPVRLSEARQHPHEGEPMPLHQAHHPIRTAGSQRSQRISLRRQGICVANVNGDFTAMDNICLHRGGPLGQGMIEGRQSRLPLAWLGLGPEDRRSATQSERQTRGVSAEDREWRSADRNSAELAPEVPPELSAIFADNRSMQASQPAKRFLWAGVSVLVLIGVAAVARRTVVLFYPGHLEVAALLLRPRWTQASLGTSC